MIPIAMILVVLLFASTPAHSLDVVIFGNAAKGSPKELRLVQERVKQDLGINVRIHVHNVLVSWSDQSAPVNFDSLARDIEHSDVVVLDNMGPMPAPFTEELSKRVLRTSIPSMPEFLRKLSEAKRKRLVAYVTGDQHDFVILGPDCRKVIDDTAAVVNLGFLFRFSPSLVPVVEFLAWLADPSVPTSRLHLSDLRISFVALYVPGEGWRFPKVPGGALEAAYHRWLSELEGRIPAKGPLWTEIRLGMLPSWVESIRRASSEFFRNVHLPKRHLVVVLDYVDALYKGEEPLVRAITDAINREVSREFPNVMTIAVLCDGNVVSPVEALLGLKRSGYDIDAIVSLWAFTMDYPKPGTWALSEIGAPVIKVVYPFWADWMDEPRHYLNMSKGFGSGRIGAIFEWGYQVIGGPEPEGAFWFKMVGLKERERMRVFPLRDMVKDLARTVVGFLRLRYLPESKKRVAFVLYCYPPGRGEIGASYLDVFQSLVRIFESMVERGYDLGPATSLYRKLAELRRKNPKAAEEMEKRVAHALMAASDLVLKNVGPWARGELAKMVSLYRGGHAETSVNWNGKRMKVVVDHGKVIWIDVDGSSYVLGTVSRDQLVPVQTLERWYQEDIVSRFRYYLSLLKGNDPLTRLARKSLLEWMRAVEEKFGPPTDNKGIMRYGGYYVVPALCLGNVVVMLQPVRGWSGSPELVYHSPDLPPQWQYIAAYEWVRRVFHADVVVHVGTHGTLEWLPGHQVGLLGVDWPHVLLPDVPHVYLYIASNPGEAMVAKYRSGPILLTHLPPPWGYFKDMSKYGELERELVRFFQMKNFGGDPRVIEELKRRIVETSKRLGLLKTVVDIIAEDQKVPPPKDPEKWALEHIDEFIDKLHDFILDLALRNVAYGLHVYGEDVGKDVAVGEAAALASSRVAPVFAYYAGLTDSPDQLALNRLQSRAPDLFVRFKQELRACLRDILWTILKYHPDLVRQLERYVRLKDREEYLGQVVGGIGGPAEEARRLFWRMEGKLVELVREAIERHFHRWRKDRDHEHLLARAVAELYRIYVHYRDSGRTELENLLAAFDGRFVPPGMLGEPMWNDKVLPTGRDGYPIDPTLLPTPEAWNVAKKLVDEMLADYYRKHGKWPEAVGVILWGVHELCTGGLGIAEVLYLLGVRPVWNPDTGQVMGVELIPLSDLKVKIGNRWVRRPRIDVVVWGALHMDPLVKLLTEAYYLVSHVNEPTEWNYRRKHYLELKPRLESKLMRNGTSPKEAETLADVVASSGFFAQPPGVYTGTGACDVIEHAWTDVSGTVGVFENSKTALKEFERRFWKRFQVACENRMAYVYAAQARILTVREGNRVRVIVLNTSTDRVYHAIRSVEAFRYLMSKVDVVLHNVVNTWGLIDTDDFYDWVGGMAFYATHVSGHAPEVYIGNAVDPTAARMLTGYQQLVGEVYAKLLSESWWKAMLEHGDYGWSRVAKRIEYLAGWGFTVPSLRPYLNAVYTRAFDVLAQRIAQASPHTEYGWSAVVGAVAWFVELARVGVWRPDAKTLARAAELLLRTMAAHGPATCHHTSPNPALVAYATRALLEVGYPKTELEQLLSRVISWYAKLDNPTIVQEIERLVREVMARTANSASSITSRTSGTPSSRTSTSASTAKTSSTSTNANNGATHGGTASKPSSASQTTTLSRGSVSSTTTVTPSRTSPSATAHAANFASTITSSSRSSLASQTVAVASSVASQYGSGTPGSRTGAPQPLGLTGTALQSPARATGSSAGSSTSAASASKTVVRAASRESGHSSQFKASRASSKERVRRQSAASVRAFARASPPSSTSRVIWEWVAALLLTFLIFLATWRKRGEPIGGGSWTTWITVVSVPPTS